MKKIFLILITVLFSFSAFSFEVNYIIQKNFDTMCMDEKNNEMYLFNKTGTMYVLNTQTGNILYNKKIEFRDNFSIFLQNCLFFRDNIYLYLRPYKSDYAYFYVLDKKGNIIKSRKFANYSIEPDFSITENGNIIITRGNTLYYLDENLNTLFDVYEDYIYTLPVEFGNRIFSSNAPIASQHSGDIFIYEKDGTLFRHTELDGYTYFTYPVTDKKLNTLYYAVTQKHGMTNFDVIPSKVYALNADGTIKWETETYGGNTETVLDEDHNLYVSSWKEFGGPSRIYCISPEGNILWFKDIPLIGRVPFIYVVGISSDKTVYFFLDSDTDHFCSLDKDMNIQTYDTGEISEFIMDKTGNLYLLAGRKFYCFKDDNGGYADSEWPMESKSPSRNISGD